MAWLSVIGSFIAMLMSSMDIQITNAAIERIQAAMHAPLAAGYWLSSVYLIAEIVTLPLTGLLTRMLGLRRYGLIFVCLFMLGSVLCANAWNLGSLICFRALQGIASGALAPFAYTLIITKLPVSSHSKAIGVFGATVALGPTLGPGIAGWLTEIFGWQSLFYINLPIGVLAAAMLNRGLRHDTRHDQGPVHFDLLGVVSAVVGMGCLQYVLGEGYKEHWFASHIMIGLAVAAVLALAVFVANELKSSHPLINLTLFRNSQLSIACAATALTCGLLFGSYFLIPYFLITVESYTPIQIGSVILVTGLAQFAILAASPTIMRRFDLHLVIMAGAALFATSAFVMTASTVDFRYSWLLFSQIVRGIGQSLMLAPLCVAMTTAVEHKEDAASAGILFNMSRSLGGAIGVALLSSYVNARRDAHMAASPPTSALSAALERSSYALAFHDTFAIIAAGLVLIGSVFAVLYYMKQSKVRGALAVGSTDSPG
jgi:MFS transporter, DHA2 family, multidrug resistance protein